MPSRLTLKRRVHAVRFAGAFVAEQQTDSLRLLVEVGGQGAFVAAISQSRGDRPP
jgi:hypothetical protein